MTLSDYIKSLNKRYQTGNAREHAYRIDLEQLMQHFAPSLSITNEPANVTNCGNPDFVLMQKEIPVGYVEAKDIGKNLDAKLYQEQFTRYLNALDNLIITDYLSFRFYRNGKLIEKVNIAEVKDHKIVALPDNFIAFENLFKDFANYIGTSIKSAQKLAELMAAKARLLQNILEKALVYDVEKEETTQLKSQYEGFKQMLINDLTPPQFADVYAQTLAYGMFAARLHDPNLNDFSRQEAANLIPSTNPFLRKLFQFVAGYDIDIRIKATVDNLAEVFRAADVWALLQSFDKQNVQQDPIIHFYETFLAAYNPALRKSRGVWYTPTAVVGFIVRATDDLLKKDFDIEAGLADTSKTTVNIKTDNFHKKTNKPIYKEVEMHRVQILDPATGTGTFLAHIVQHIYDTRFKAMQGMWTSYVDNELIPRLNGFELLMASYAMAHLKMDLLLYETGYAGDANRFKGLRPLERLASQNDSNINDENEGLLNFANGRRPSQQFVSNPFKGLRPLERLETQDDEVSNFANGRRPLQQFDTQQRFRIFLTNSLEESHPDTHTLFTQWLADEANQANAIKRDSPVMVVMGNPPYSGHSANTGAWIENLLKDYKQEPKGGRLQEKNPKWLNDDYVKFIRFGQHFIDKNKEGILAYINNHSFLDNPTFRGMRWHLMNSFDSIYIIDLHGNSKKKETAPDGSPDKNVFDIQQGVSINLFVKTGKKADNELAQVYHYDLYGSREEKYDFLSKNSLSDIPFTTLQPDENMYFFVNKNIDFKEEYDKGFSITDLFPVNSVGIVTARDNFTIHHNVVNLKETIEKFMLLDNEMARNEFNLGKDTRDWQISYAKADLKKHGVTVNEKKVSIPNENIVKINYRPFDTRYTFYTGKSKGFLCMPRGEVMQHFVNHTNIGLVIGRQGQVIGDMEWNLSFIASNITDFNLYYRGGNVLFPIYLYPKTEENLFNSNKATCTPNLNPTLLHQISTALQLTFDPSPLLPTQKPFKQSQTAQKVSTHYTPLNLLDYIYAILHSPHYRHTYKEFLKIDFPRIPYPTNAPDFWRLVRIGQELRLFHLLEHPLLGSGGFQNPPNLLQDKLPTISYPFEGNNKVEKIYYENDSVYINESQCFTGVPATAWNMYIGGYQPAQKWLKDRKERILTYEDILHYGKIVVALQATVLLMEEIDS